MVNKPTVNDLFCGCGGIGLAFQQEGFEIKGAWDFDKYAVESYRANVGDHVKQADITQMRFWNMPKADVWSFGFPCQDLSVAGKQAGLFEGKRSGLFFEVMRLLDEAMEYEPKTMPKMLLAENVKGLKPYLDVLKAEYKKRGYTAHITLFNSKYWGVPQNRERYFIVGTRDDLNLDFSFPTQQTDFVPKLSSILEANVDEKYYLSDEKAAKIIEQALLKLDKLGKIHSAIDVARVEKTQNGRRAKAEEEEMFTLTAQDLHGVICQASGMLDPEGVGRTLRVGEKGSISEKHNYEHVLEKPVLIVPEATQKGYAEAYEGDSCNINFLNSETRRGRVGHGVAQTLLTGQEQVVIQNYRVRKLTPTEYGKLQGFPMDTWQQVVSNSQAYKQFGNAVTVNVVRAIAGEIKRTLTGEEPQKLNFTQGIEGRVI